MLHHASKSFHISCNHYTEYLGTVQRHNRAQIYRKCLLTLLPLDKLEKVYLLSKYLVSHLILQAWC